MSAPVKTFAICGSCKNSIPISEYATRQRNIIAEGEDGICKECMDIKYEYCQRVALEMEMDNIEAEKKRDLSTLKLKFDEEKYAKHRIKIEECYQSRLRTLHEQKENLGKKNVEVYALDKRQC